jgi:hypothetical protein
VADRDGAGTEPHQKPVRLSLSAADHARLRVEAAQRGLTMAACARLAVRMLWDEAKTEAKS